MGYEYMVAKARVEHAETEKLLDELGRRGWELISVVGPCPSSTDTLYLRRVRP